MIIDALLALTFFASLFMLWYRVSARIPELIAIPDEVITARLEEDSAKLRLFLLQIKSYYREEKYKHTFWRVWGKTLYKVHIGLLRLDNGTLNLLKRTRERTGVVNGLNGKDNVAYWKQLKEEPHAASTPKGSNKIREIRSR